MSPPHGAFVWYELMTSDPQAAAAFYRDVIGWTAQDAGMPGKPYTLFSASDTMVAGLMAIPDEVRAMGIPPCWTGYVGVADVDAMLADLRAAGGTLRRPAEDIPTVGRFAVVADPQGAVFILFSPFGNPPRPTVAPGTPGHVGWHELYAADGAAAFAFYAKLFGWTKADAIEMGPMGTYQLFTTGGAPVGGIMTKPPQVPVPCWGVRLQRGRNQRRRCPRTNRRRPGDARPDAGAGRPIGRPLPRPARGDVLDGGAGIGAFRTLSRKRQAGLFVNKKNQKTSSIPWRCLTFPTWPVARGPKFQKFFAPFFQKKECLQLACFAPRIAPGLNVRQHRRTNLIHIRIGQIRVQRQRHDPRRQILRHRQRRAIMRLRIGGLLVQGFWIVDRARDAGRLQSGLHPVPRRAVLQQNRIDRPGAGAVRYPCRRGHCIA